MASSQSEEEFMALVFVVDQCRVLAEGSDKCVEAQFNKHRWNGF